MKPLVVVTDAVVEDIERLVASHAPERGGALVGPVGQPVVSAFLLDDRATTSGTTFRPSTQLQRRVSEVESGDETLELKGILHSHPGAMNHPSSGDLVAYEDSLRGAPWLGQFICPIVTRGRPSAQHEITLPSGRVSFYVADATGGREADLHVATVRVMPLLRDASALAGALGAAAPTLGTVDVDGQVYLTADLAGVETSYQMLLPAGYPTAAPLLLATRTSDGLPSNAVARALSAALPPRQTSQIPLSWSLEVEDTSRLLTAVGAAAAVQAPAPQPPREPDVPAPSTGGNRTLRANLSKEESGASPALPSPEGSARAGIRERLDGVASARIAARRVLLAGCGSGGSQTAELLARSGVERFTLVDADTVSSANLSRSVYTIADIGRPKVHSLSARLKEINPDVEVDERQTRLQDLAARQIDELVRGSELVIAATDDANAQRLLNHFAYSRGVPAVFAGVYARGVAGEVLFTVPGLTPCYRCVTSSRGASSGPSPATDYGTGRLAGEPALGADITHIVSASVKVAVGLLQIEDEVDNSSRNLIVDALTAECNYLVMSTVPKWDFFAELFASVPGQLAYQSVWLSGARDPQCPVCGESPVDPLQAPTRGPRVLDLRSTRAGPTLAAPDEPTIIETKGTT